MRRRASSVLVLAPEPLSLSAPGPARRAAKLAEVLGRHLPVTLAAPSPSEFPAGPFQTLDTGPIHDQRLAGAFSRHEVAVVQALPSPRLLLSAIRHSRSLVVDLIAPLVFEAAEAPARSAAARQAMVDWRTHQLMAHVAAADLVLCTNERQRDLILGLAVECRRPTVGGDATLDGRLVAVVPHGVDDEPPRRSGSPLRAAGVVGTEDRVAVWAGGLWPWLDPLTPVQAVERLHGTRPDLRLVFVGADLASEAGRSHRAREVLTYVSDRGLEGGPIVFVPGRLDRQDYVDHLFDADVGVSAHPATMESRYATRTRILDYLAVGLPVVCTRDEAMADFVEANAAGEVAAPSDAGDFAAALDRAMAGGRGDWDERILDPFRWTNAARPLVEFCLDPGAFPRPRRAPAAVLAIREYGPFLRSIYRAQGVAGLVSGVRRRARLG